jgi:hypothetical protein
MATKLGNQIIRWGCRGYDCFRRWKNYFAGTHHGEIEGGNAISSLVRITVRNLLARIMQRRLADVA